MTCLVVCINHQTIWPLTLPKQALVFMCMLYKSFENNVGKGKIACYKQFLLFSLCFLPVLRTFCHLRQICNCCLQTLSVWKSLKFVVWERVNNLTRQKKPFETIMGKGENAGLQVRFVFENGRKYSGKTRTCWNWHISFFNYVFKRSFSQLQQKSW